MKIITKGVLDWDGKVLHEEAYEYTGPLARAQAAPPAAQYVPTVFDPRTQQSDYFWYQNRIAGISSVAPTANSQINLDADSDFYCVALTSVTGINTAGLDAPYTESGAPLPLVTLLINDTGSGKNLMNGALLIPGFTGDGKRPYRFVRPRVFMANATIQLAFSGQFLAAGTSYDIQIIFHGYKVYR